MKTGVFKIKGGCDEKPRPDNINADEKENLQSNAC